MRALKRGQGKTTTTRGSQRALMLGGVGFSALLLAMPGAALADDWCTQVGSEFTCQGDQSEGLWFTDEATKVTVKNLTGDIAPTGTSGIAVFSEGPITVNSDTGAYAIKATGNDAKGIYLKSFTNTSSIVLDHNGDISATHGAGIVLDSWGSAQEKSVGDIVSSDDAIRVHSAVSGSAWIEHTGDLTSSAGYGAHADGFGSVLVSVTGAVDSYLDGIKATSAGSGSEASVTVIANGDITSSHGRGIYANGSYRAVTVTSVGDIDAYADGVVVLSNGTDTDANSELKQTGDVSSTTGKGIDVESANHSAKATIVGDVDAQLAGVTVVAFGNNSDASATVDITGDVTSRGDYGVYVKSVNHSAGVTVMGDVTAKKDAITAKADGTSSDASATVTSTGDVTSSEGKGIVATSLNHAAWVKSVGAIDSYYDGIAVEATGSNYDASAVATSTGDITSSHGRGINVHSANYNASATSIGDIDAGTDGIYVVTEGSDSSATALISSTGDVSATAGYGLYAKSANAHVEITSVGDVDSKKTGISAITTGSDGSATAKVTSTGDVTSTDGQGIRVESSNHHAELKSIGDVSGGTDGIYVLAAGSSYDASAFVDSNGDVTGGTGYGIYASSANMHVEVTSVGDVKGGSDAIYAHSSGADYSADVVVSSKGDITSTSGRGIYAGADNRQAKVTSVGDVMAGTDGIYVISTGTDDDANVFLSSKGDVTATGGYGLYANSAYEYAEVLSEGDITSGKDGIYAVATGEDQASKVKIRSVGDITSTGGTGIYAKSAYHGVDLNSKGDIEAAKDGIYVLATGYDSDSLISLIQTGDVIAHDGYGVYAASAQHAVSADIKGDITSSKDGIHLESTGDDNQAHAWLTQSGDIDAGTATGIYVSSARESVSIVSSGDITGHNGIVAKTTGSSNTATAYVGHVGDIVVDAGGIGISGYASNQWVQITQTGDITGGKTGIKAQSESTNVLVQVQAGSTISGQSDAAIDLSGITGIIFDNAGTVDGGDGYAVKAKGYGGTSIDNTGTLIGSIDIDDAYSTIVNEATGRFDIDSVELSHGGVLTNHGILSPGGDGTIATATLDGGLVQKTDGTIIVDVSGASSDQLQVAGAAALDGSLKLHFIDLVGPSQPLTVLTSNHLDTANLTLLATMVTAGSTLSYVDGTDVVVNVDYNFAPQGLSGTGSKIASVLDADFEAGAPDMAPLFAGLANLETTDEYQAAVEQLSPDVYADQSAALVSTNAIFANRLLSCKVEDGAYAFSAEGQCAWFNVGADRLTQTASGDTLGYQQSTATISAGGQLALGADWRLGVGFGYSQTSSSNDLGNTAEGELLEAGAVVKYDHDGMVLAASLTGGHATTDTTRSVSFGGFDDVATGDGASDFISARLHGAYDFALGDAAYLRPMVDFDVTKLHFGGFTEAGGASALEIGEGDALVATLSPALELGGQIDFGTGAVARPYVRVGASISAGDDLTVLASFAGAPENSFEVSSGTDQLLGKLGAGVDIVTVGNSALRLYYEGSFGEHLSQNGFGLKLTGGF